MGVGRHFNPGNLMQVALALSLAGPDLQSYLTQGPPAIPQISNGGTNGPYNMTSVAFNPMSPSTSASSVDRYLAAKAAAVNQNPFSQFLDWHLNKEQFNNDAVAMLFEGGPTCHPRLGSDSESGYMSDGVLSPCAPVQDPQADLSELGAVGYTPPPSATTTETSIDWNVDLNLDDFLDLSSFEPNSSVKVEPPSPTEFDFTGVKLEPNAENVRCTTTQHSPYKSSIEEIDLQSPFDFDVEQLYDPYTIDFSSVSGTQQFPNQETDFDGLEDFDFDFPSDIFCPPDNEDHFRNDLLDQVLTEATTGSRAQASEPALFPPSEFNLKDAALPALAGAFRDAQPSPDTRVPKVEPKEVLNPPQRATALSNKGARPKVLKPTFSKLPVSEERLIDMSVNDFNELVEKLTEEDAQYARDIRRRGKNKEAARLCRKRKMEAISGLDDELGSLQAQRAKVLEERKKLQEETNLWKNKLSELEGFVFKSLRDDNGQPLSSTEYSLFQGSNGNVYVGKNINARPKRKSSNNKV